MTVNLTTIKTPMKGRVLITLMRMMKRLMNILMMNNWGRRMIFYRQIITNLMTIVMKFMMVLMTIRSVKYSEGAV